MKICINIWDFSRSNTLSPNSAAFFAAVGPAQPAPTIAISYSFLFIVVSASIVGNSKGILIKNLD